MKMNVCNPIEKTARIIIGLVLLSLIFFLEGNARWVGLIGLVPIATVLIRWCPISAALGISSCPAAGKH